METQLIRFDGLTDRQIDKILFNNPILRANLRDIAYAGYSEKMKNKMIKKTRESNFKQFIEDMKFCPICGELMENCNEVIIKVARNSTVVNHCPNCEIIVGRYT